MLGFIIICNSLDPVVCEKVSKDVILILLVMNDTLQDE